ncbi:MAG: Hpt domain-containing protein, partial [Candidatus Cloacimonetes bacterium]|nr:Hpt domain-containing protein [Candidatus Cloacimonadota bacterium]
YSTVPDSVKFDKDKLLRKIGNDNEVMTALISTVLEIFPGYFQSLERAVEEKNIENIKMIAHKIKGGALNMSFAEIVEIVTQLEENNAEDFLLTIELYRKLLVRWEELEKMLISLAKSE